MKNVSYSIVTTFILMISLFFQYQSFAQDASSGYQVKAKDVLNIKFYRHVDLNQEEIEVSPRGTLFMSFDWRSRSPKYDDKSD